MCNSFPPPFALYSVRYNRSSETAGTRLGVSQLGDKIVSLILSLDALFDVKGH